MRGSRIGKGILAGFVLAAASGAALHLSRGDASAGSGIAGEYVEARTCDVWTGPCFANGEMNLRGENAVLAWRITKGKRGGEDLSGLSVVAALDSEGTLTTNAEGRVRSVVYVDERAPEAARAALVEIAKSLAPRYLKDIVEVRPARISFRAEGSAVSVSAGGDVTLETVALSRHCDSICGNEASFYPPLASIEVECAKAVENAYSGKALGPRWSDPNKRSAMIGRFSL
jgi:hypothetical protein